MFTRNPRLELMSIKVKDDGIEYRWLGKDNSAYLALKPFGIIINRLCDQKDFRDPALDSLNKGEIEEEYYSWAINGRSLFGNFPYQPPTLYLTFGLEGKEIQIYSPGILLYPEIYLRMLIRRELATIRSFTFDSPYNHLHFSHRLGRFRLNIQEISMYDGVKDDISRVITETIAIH